MAGKAVTFTVTGGGGTVGGSSSTTVSSAADGTVATTWLPGSSLGAQTLRAGVSATEYVDVAVTATQPPPSQLSLTMQPSATAQSGAALAQPPVVQLKDASGGNVPQSGLAVTASIESGGDAGWNRHGQHQRERCSGIR